MITAKMCFFVVFLSLAILTGTYYVTFKINQSVDFTAIKTQQLTGSLNLVVIAGLLQEMGMAYENEEDLFVKAHTAYLFLHAGKKTSLRDIEPGLKAWLSLQT